jgi:hypothetical protein
MHSWAMLDYSVTQRFWKDPYTQLSIRKNADAEITLSWHSGIPGFWHCTLSTFRSVDMQGAPLYAFVPFIVNSRMPHHRHLGSSVQEPETVQYQNQGTHFGTRMLRYLTEKTDVGMPMPSYECMFLLFTTCLDRAIETNIRSNF